MDRAGVVELTCTPELKAEERRERQVAIDDLERQIDRVTFKMQGTQNKD